MICVCAKRMLTSEWTLSTLFNRLCCGCRHAVFLTHISLSILADLVTYIIFHSKTTLFKMTCLVSKEGSACVEAQSCAAALANIHNYSLTD